MCDCVCFLAVDKSNEVARKPRRTLLSRPHANTLRSARIHRIDVTKNVKLFLCIYIFTLLLLFFRVSNLPFARVPQARLPMTSCTPRLSPPLARRIRMTATCEVKLRVAMIKHFADRIIILALECLNSIKINSAIKLTPRNARKMSQAK